MSSAFGKLIYNFFFGRTFMFLNHDDAVHCQFWFILQQTFIGILHIHGIYFICFIRTGVQIKYGYWVTYTFSSVEFLVHQNLYIAHTP